MKAPDITALDKALKVKQYLNATISKNKMSMLSLHQMLHYLPGLHTAPLMTRLMELKSEAALVICFQ